MGFTDYDRLKWEVLAHTPHRFGFAAAWYEARELEPNDPGAQAELVARVVPELFDEGLIFCAYASRDDGYNLELDEFLPKTRDDLELELTRPDGYVEPEERLFWLLPTPAGLEMLDSLPKEAFRPRPDPLPPEEFDRRMRAIQHWVETGEGSPPFPFPDSG